jgi:hypothetical protein
MSQLRRPSRSKERRHSRETRVRTFSSAQAQATWPKAITGLRRSLKEIDFKLPLIQGPSRII